MTTFQSSYLELEPRELVRFVLREAGQIDNDAVNPAELLDYLKLAYISFDFARELPTEIRQRVSSGQPRALISFGDRLVATDSSLSEPKSRFSVLHEIGHYLLPHHQHTLYVCDDLGMSAWTRLAFEQEANAFAAELLFQGERFSLEANSHPVTAAAVKQLAEKYKASFEATARRLVEKNFRPCMLVVFKQDSGRQVVDPNAAQSWTVKYCVSSPSFKLRFFDRVSGSIPAPLLARVAVPGRDIADSIVEKVQVGAATGGEARRVNAEFFWNTYNVFALLTPEAPDAQG